jgi:hypothetical protein
MLEVKFKFKNRDEVIMANPLLPTTIPRWKTISKPIVKNEWKA